MKKKSCDVPQKWRKYISNHFWWVCVTSEGGEELLHEKWLSVYHYHRLTKKELKRTQNRLKRYKTLL